MKPKQMKNDKIKQIFVTVTWMAGGLAAWIFGTIAWMTVIAPRLPNVISYVTRTFHSASSPVLFVINSLPQAIFAFISGALLCALTGYRKFLIFTAVAAPNLLAVLQSADTYQYESMTYRGEVPKSVFQHLIEREITVLLVFPAALWAGAALIDRVRNART